MQFLGVYVREAHAADGWWPQAEGQTACDVLQPKTLEERAGVAQRCCQKLNITMPLLVDAMDDRVGHAYSGMPDRLYVIDRGGRVAYKGGRGPFGFRPLEMEQALAMLLLDEQQGKAAGRQGRLPVLGNEDAWKRLPGAPEAAERLPAWARMLAGRMPRTTALMLNLDALHRTGDRLDPQLRAKMRWVAADAGRCEYARAAAAADFRRAGGDIAALRQLAGDWRDLPENERAALTFARKLTAQGSSVTDEDVRRVIRHYGDRQTVAMVALIAHAAFQDRVLLALDPPVEDGGPPPPVAARFPHTRTPPAPPPAQRPKVATGLTGSGPAVVTPDRDWLSRTFGDLQQGMAAQRSRPARIRVPAADEVYPHLPPGSWGLRWPRVNWNLVCYGHQPELTDAWFDCVDASRQENKPDRLFANDLFWVVTRATDCFY